MMIKISQNISNHGLEIQIAIKQFINYLRSNFDLSILKLSERSGLDRSTLYGIMGNMVIPQIKSVNNILDSFDCCICFVHRSHEKEVIDLWNYVNWDAVWEAYDGEKGTFWILEMEDV